MAMPLFSGTFMSPTVTMFNMPVGGCGLPSGSRIGFGGEKGTEVTGAPRAAVVAARRPRAGLLPRRIGRAVLGQALSPRVDHSDATVLADVDVAAFLRIIGVDRVGRVVELDLELV